MTDFVGRADERRVISQAIRSKEAEFIAVYGLEGLGKRRWFGRLVHSRPCILSWWEKRMPACPLS